MMRNLWEKTKTFLSEVDFLINNVPSIWVSLFFLSVVCIERGAYFDNFFCNVSNSSQFSLSHSSNTYSSENQEKNDVKLEYISKIKSIANLFILILLLDPLLDNFLEVINVNTYVKKLILIFIALFIDFISGFYILWYAYFRLVFKITKIL